MFDPFDNGLEEEVALNFARIALDCMQREYPNKLNQVLKTEADLKSPKDLHPAFYGCFDWHSSVHGHWMLIRIMKQFPDNILADEIRTKLGENLTAENLQGEVLYFNQASPSWERTYGWAWLLKLAEELYTWDDPQAKVWYTNINDLAEVVAKKYVSFLPTQQYPVRTGVHPNTAFGLSFAHDYAQAIGDLTLRNIIEKRALDYYSKDKKCPCTWEPSGEDFLSPCLEEANLMARVLPTKVFKKWFRQFLSPKELKFYEKPADVSDRSDPKIVHLDGLNLSRAWCLFYLSKVTEGDYPELREMAESNLNASLPHVATEHYEGSHWLASFAIYALSQK
jgi:hypothetical protein